MMMMMMIMMMTLMTIMMIMMMMMMNSHTKCNSCLAMRYICTHHDGVAEDYDHDHDDHEMNGTAVVHDTR